MVLLAAVLAGGSGGSNPTIAKGKVNPMSAKQGTILLTGYEAITEALIRDNSLVAAAAEAIMIAYGRDVAAEAIAAAAGAIAAAEADSESEAAADSEAIAAAEAAVAAVAAEAKTRMAAAAAAGDFKAVAAVAAEAAEAEAEAKRKLAIAKDNNVITGSQMFTSRGKEAAGLVAAAAAGGGLENVYRIKAFDIRRFYIVTADSVLVFEQTDKPAAGDCQQVMSIAKTSLGKLFPTKISHLNRLHWILYSNGATKHTDSVSSRLAAAAGGGLAGWYEAIGLPNSTHNGANGIVVMDTPPDRWIAQNVVAAAEAAAGKPNKKQ